MKRILILSILLCSISAFGQLPLIKKQPHDSMARVVIIRESNHLASWFVFKLYQFDNQVGKIRNKSYFDGYLNSGKDAPVYTFGQQEDSLALIESPQPGVTYYLLLEVLAMPKDTNRPYKKSDFTFRLSEISRDVANKIILDGYLTKTSTQSMTPFALMNSNFGHIDFKIGTGVGLMSYDAFEKSNGGTVKISPGGGSIYGLRAGYTFNRFFDISAGAGYQISSLNQPLNNATGNFGRFVFNANFLGMLMLSHTNFIGLGAGVNSYNSPRLTLNAKQINGDIVRFYYKDVVGYQIFSEWRLIVKRFCMSAQLRYYTVTYNLDHLTLNGAPAVLIPGNNGEDYSKLNGGGIDLELGFGFLF